MAIIEPSTASASSVFFSFLCLGLFIWGRPKSVPTVDPVHGPHGTPQFEEFRTDLGAFCSWWAPNHLTLHALETRYFKKQEETALVSRRSAGECLTVPFLTENAIRVTPTYPPFLVDHTSPKGGVFKDQACHGYPNYVPSFDTSLASWVGCSHTKHPSWTGYVCVNPSSGTVALKCFDFNELQGCDLEEFMPCPPHEEDVGCKSGLIQGESCRHHCPPGQRSNAFFKEQSTCPLLSPECEPVCPIEKIPLSPEWVPFLVIWNDQLQSAKVEAINPKLKCTPQKLACGDSYLNVQCRPIHCGKLAWANITKPRIIGSLVYPQCQEGFASKVPVITCGLLGKWSHEDNACAKTRFSNIIVDRGPCIHNKRNVTQTVLDPGFPPITLPKRETWVERCKSTPPSCCKDHGLASSYGFYDSTDQPRCQCKYPHLGAINPGPCCELQNTLAAPALVFFQSYRGTFDLIPCENGLCTASACYGHPLGCLAFNKTHMARHAARRNELKQAFSWKF